MEKHEIDAVIEPFKIDFAPFKMMQRLSSTLAANFSSTVLTSYFVYLGEDVDSPEGFTLFSGTRVEDTGAFSTSRRTKLVRFCAKEDKVSGGSLNAHVEVPANSLMVVNGDDIEMLKEVSAYVDNFKSACEKIRIFDEKTNGIGSRIFDINTAYMGDALEECGL